MEEPKITTNDSCPVCGYKDRVVEGIAQKEKDEGRMSPLAENAAIRIEAVIAETKWMETMPFGSSVPSIVILCDVCGNCGTVYAFRIVERRATKHMAPNKPIPKPTMFSPS